MSADFAHELTAHDYPTGAEAGRVADESSAAPVGVEHPQFEAFKERVLANPEARAAYEAAESARDLAAELECGWEDEPSEAEQDLALSMARIAVHSHWLAAHDADHTARIVAALDAERDRQTADLHPAGAEYGRVRAMFARVVAVVEGVS